MTSCPVLGEQLEQEAVAAAEVEYPLVALDPVPRYFVARPPVQRPVVTWPTPARVTPASGQDCIQSTCQ